MSDDGGKAETSVEHDERGPLVCVSVARPALYESHVTCVPRETAGTGDAATQAREVYGALVSWLRERGAAGVQERILGSLRHCRSILAQRKSALGANFGDEAWPATFVEGGPWRGEGLAGVHLYAVAGPECHVVRRGERVCGVTFEHQDMRHVYLSGLAGSRRAGTPREEAESMFREAAAVLNDVGVSYSSVVRTWIYVADILGWYEQFNQARSAQYLHLCPTAEDGSRWLPASTGIEGRSPTGARCIMDLFALGGPGRDRIRVEAVHNPLQSEAYTYGSDFSRGAAVAFDGLEAVYVSGTAAIDERGRSVCSGNVAGQVARTLDNVEALLDTRGMTLDDLACSTAFLKHGADAEAARAVIEERGARLANSVFVAADVCRPDLLFEVDGLAVRAVG